MQAALGREVHIQRERSVKSSCHISDQQVVTISCSSCSLALVSFLLFLSLEFSVFFLAHWTAYVHSENLFFVANILYNQTIQIKTCMMTKQFSLAHSQFYVFCPNVHTQPVKLVLLMVWENTIAVFLVGLI